MLTPRRVYSPPWLAPGNAHSSRNRPLRPPAVHFARPPPFSFNGAMAAYKTLSTTSSSPRPSADGAAVPGSDARRPHPAPPYTQAPPHVIHSPSPGAGHPIRLLQPAQHPSTSAAATRASFLEALQLRRTRAHRHLYSTTSRLEYRLQYHLSATRATIPRVYCCTRTVVHSTWSTTRAVQYRAAHCRPTVHCT